MIIEPAFWQLFFVLYEYPNCYLDSFIPNIRVIFWEKKVLQPKSSCWGNCFYFSSHKWGEWFRKMQLWINYIPIWWQLLILSPFRKSCNWPLQYKWANPYVLTNNCNFQLISDSTNHLKQSSVIFILFVENHDFFDENHMIFFVLKKMGESFLNPERSIYPCQIVGSINEKFAGLSMNPCLRQHRQGHLRRIVVREPTSLYEVVRRQ